MQLLTGIDQSTYSELERGLRPMSTGQCIQLALALDTSTDYLLGLTDQITPDVPANQAGMNKFLPIQARQNSADCQGYP